MTPQEVTTVEATWDAHDVVWVGDVLAAERVGAGLLLAVLGSVVPTVLYVGALYWLDRHEKEPALLLAAALLWGSIPALFLALAAEILFRLPPDLLGPSALGAAQLGLVAPLLQETVKGVAVLFIALRYWREFDDPLDGAIYGAVVGFGFAMTGSLIDRVGSFALWGFEGFSVGTFVEGPLFALRHAAYTALFGISLSLARVVRQRWQRWAVPSAGLALAVMAHVLNNLSTWSLLGVDAVAVLTSAAGLMLIAAVAVWSFRRQQRSLRSQLQDELPDALYRTLLTPQGRASAAWQAFRTGGLGSWRRTRRLHERSMALAARKREQRDHPNEPRLALEIDRLRGLIDTLVE